MAELGSRMRVPMLAALAILAVTGRAFAQDASRPTADSALDEARRASSAGDAARALDLAMRAASSESTPATRLFIARQQAALGQIVQSIASTQQCLREADADPSLPNRAGLTESCQSLNDSLIWRLAHVTVIPPFPAPPDLLVIVGGTVLVPSEYERPIDLNPGRVLLHAVGTGVAAVHATVMLAPGQAFVLRLAPALPPPPPTMRRGTADVDGERTAPHADAPCDALATRADPTRLRGAHRYLRHRHCGRFCRRRSQRRASRRHIVVREHILCSAGASRVPGHRRRTGRPEQRA